MKIAGTTHVYDMAVLGVRHVIIHHEPDGVNLLGKRYKSL